MEIDASFIAALAIVTGAGLIFGLTGFGFAMISVPVLLLAYDPATVVILTLVLSIATCLLVILDAWRARDLRIVLAMLPGATVGLFLGSYLLAVVSPDVINFVAGAIVVAFSIVMLRGMTLSGADHPLAPSFVGGISGALATSTGLSGPPPVMLLSARKYPRDSFRVNMAVYFVVINTIGLVALATQGVLTTEHVSITAQLLPTTLIGAVAGARLARYVPPVMFRRLTLSLVLLTGTMGVITASVALL